MVDKVLVLLDKLKAWIELLRSKLFTHVLLESVKVAACDVDHFFLSDVGCFRHCLLLLCWSFILITRIPIRSTVRIRILPRWRLILLIIRLNPRIIQLLLILSILVIKESLIIILRLHILLGRLISFIQLHLSHLLRQLSLLLILGRFLLHCKLCASKLFKHVLIVQDSVCELIFELSSFQEFGDAGCDLGHF